LSIAVGDWHQGTLLNSYTLDIIIATLFWIETTWILQ
jgi:hypothetical protein